MSGGLLAAGVTAAALIVGYRNSSYLSYSPSSSRSWRRCHEDRAKVHTRRAGSF